MGKKTKNSSADDVRKKHSCRMAYSLNNSQPVLCTIVSDQPLFYLDQADTTDDDDILMDEELVALDRDIQNLKKKVEAYDRLSLEFSQPADTRFQEYISDASLIGDTFVSETKKIEEFLDLLKNSRIADALIQEANKYGVDISFSTQVRTALYDREAGRIFINPFIQFPDMCLLAARELRRHWQHRQGVLIDPLSFHPDQAILINRAQQADLSVFMVRVAWELQLSGMKETWERIENSSLSDLGRTFAREAYVDFRTLNNGHAASAVFETWFLSDRCRLQDKDLIQKMLADYQGKVFDISNVSKSVTYELISALGEVPFGKNYLAPYARMIVSDPIFTDVRDRSNANFLWFIKFERSFRETEHELQGDESNQSSDVLSEDIHKKRQDARHDQKDTIVAYPASAKAKSGKKGTLEDANDTTNVVFIQFC